MLCFHVPFWRAETTLCDLVQYLSNQQSNIDMKSKQRKLSLTEEILKSFMVTERHIYYYIEQTKNPICTYSICCVKEFIV